jgi:hypothetical protein
MGYDREWLVGKDCEGGRVYNNVLSLNFPGELMKITQTLVNIPYSPNEFRGRYFQIKVFYAALRLSVCLSVCQTQPGPRVTTYNFSDFIRFDRLYVDTKVYPEVSRLSR